MRKNKDTIRNLWGTLFNEIDMYKPLADNINVFAHEFGHALDHTLLKELNSDKSLKSIFDKELENYKNVTSDAEGHAIDYFTLIEEKHYAKNCLIELIAEANAIISGFSNDTFKEIGLRSVTLQQHFPETIAYIGKKLQDLS